MSIIECDQVGARELIGQAAVMIRAALRATNGRRPAAGHMACPLCDGGTVLVLVDADGRVRGECDTGDCLAFVG